MTYKMVETVKVKKHGNFTLPSKNNTTMTLSLEDEQSVEDQLMQELHDIQKLYEDSVTDAETENLGTFNNYG